ncbi:MAG: 3'-5' exonuclease [Clostridiales bacterium]|nr:3'-5' exonuclease [Clostridiales bacterium]
MNKIYSIINERAGGQYKDVRFSQVVFDNVGATVTVTCKPSEMRAIAADGELKAMLEDECAFNLPLKINVVAEDVSAIAVRNAVVDFTRKFPYVSSVADNVTVSGEPPTVRIEMHESMKKLAEGDYVPRLNEFLKNRYITPIAVAVETAQLETSADGEKKREPVVYEIGGLEPIFGTVDAQKAVSAADVIGNNDDIAVCGVLAMATDYLSKGSGAKHSRPYQKFLLYDGTGTLQCRCFPRDGFSLIDAGVVGQTVCAFGNTEVERGRVGETSMTVRGLSRVGTGGPKAFETKKAPDKYVTVKPAPYEEYVQASLFAGEDVLPKSLMGSFVAFDFETTGLSILYDKPTEIGAVKIKDGVITETFSTLIDPKRPIPEEVSKKTGITDDMVRGKPRFEDVLPDFYKFSYGCALIGHNIAFDFPFLIKYGNKFGWPFGDRRTFDTLGMAPKAIPGIDILTLDRVLDSLGLVNDNAHRALSDATATAKAFIAMSKILARK